MTSSKPLPLPRRTSALIVGSGPAALIALKYALESTAWAPGAAPVLISADEYDYYEPKAADTQTDSVDIQLRGDISDLVRGQSTPAACLAEYISTFGLAQHTHRGAVLRVEHEEGAYPHVATVRHACWGDMDQVVNIAAQRLVLVRSPKVEVKVDGGRVDKALPSGSAWRPAFGPRSLSREDAPKTKSRTPRLRSRKRHASGPLANGRGQTPDWLRIQAEQHWKQLIQLVPVRLSLGSVPLPLALPLTVLAGLPKLPPLPLVSSLVTVSHVAASIARTAADAHALIFTELDEFGVPPKYVPLVLRKADEKEERPVGRSPRVSRPNPRIPRRAGTRPSITQAPNPHPRRCPLRRRPRPSYPACRGEAEASALERGRAGR
jgi:hypothetical protein